jgi:predicted RNase H-like HicB family nuclease
MNPPRYSMIIRWSEEDQVYIAWLPEFGDSVKTHGATYEEAAKQGTEVMEMMIEGYLTEGKPPPKAWTYDLDESAEQAIDRLRQEALAANH